MGRIIPYIVENKIHVPNHQPANNKTHGIPQFRHLSRTSAVRVHFGAERFAPPHRYLPENSSVRPQSERSERSLGNPGNLFQGDGPWELTG